MAPHKCARAAPADAVRDPLKLDEFSRPVELHNSEPHRFLQLTYLSRRFSLTPGMAEMVAALAFASGTLR